MKPVNIKNTCRILVTFLLFFGAFANSAGWDTSSSSSSSSAEECWDVNGTVIYYLNGMLTPPIVANANLRRVKELFPDYRVNLAYVTSEGYFPDFIEVVKQRLTIDATPEFELSVHEMTKGVYLWLRFGDSKHSGLNEIIGDIFTELHASKLRDALTDSEMQQDFGYQLEVYKGDLVRGNNIILVAHSQGTMYAAMARNWLSNHPRSDETWSDRIGIVGAGAVVDGFPGPRGQNSYMTYHNDLVVNGVRAFLPDTLAWNFQRTQDVDNNHGFIDYFGSGSKGLKDIYPESEWGTIQTKVHNIGSNLQKRFCEKTEDESVSCAGALNWAGGDERKIEAWTLGSDTGVVKGVFTTYEVTDTVKIWDYAQNNLLYSRTGGNGTFSFNHQSGDKVYVEVIGNEIESTKWVLNMSCPGQRLSDFLNRLQVMVQCRTPGYTTNFNASVEVDGVVYSEGNNPSFSTYVPPGSHTLSYTAVCSCLNDLFGFCEPVLTANYWLDGMKTNLPINELITFNAEPRGGTNMYQKINISDDGKKITGKDSTPPMWFMLSL